MNKVDLVKRIFKTQVKKYIPELSLTFIIYYSNFSYNGSNSLAC